MNLFLDGKCPNGLGEYITSAPLTPLVKPGGGIRPIVVGTVWRRLVSKVGAILIGHSLDGYLDGSTPYGRANECSRLSLHAWYLGDGTIVGDTMVVGKVLELIMEDGLSTGLHTKLLRHTGIISPGPIFYNALSVFNTSMKTDLLSNPRVFAGDIYGDHVVSCAGNICIKHRHNVVRDTLVDICYLFGILAGKEVDIGLDGGGTNHYVQQVMIDVAQRKRIKYMAKCAAIGYGFLLFSFSSLGN
ncbi:hypothetical protein Tco_0848896 [Tanacetum coccineum]